MPAINARVVPTNTSAIISIVAIHAAMPAGTLFRVNQAILIISPPTYEGVVLVTNSLPTLIDISLEVEEILYPKKLSTKYLNLYDCKNIFPKLKMTERIKGNNPTLKISFIDIGEKMNNKMIGRRLTIIAMNRQFNISNQ